MKNKKKVKTYLKGREDCDGAMERKDVNDRGREKV